MIVMKLFSAVIIKLNLYCMVVAHLPSRWSSCLLVKFWMVDANLRKSLETFCLKQPCVYEQQFNNDSVIKTEGIIERLIVSLATTTPSLLQIMRMLHLLYESVRSS